jgi:hypothetical protein
MILIRISVTWGVAGGSIEKEGPESGARGDSGPWPPDTGGWRGSRGGPVNLTVKIS